MALTVGISLYTTRVILSVLGESDFGLYNLIAGVVILLSFFNAAMSTSTQRYLSVNLGSKNKPILEAIFCNSLVIHLILGGVLSIIFVIAEYFLFDGFLNINIERINAAKTIYYFMVLSVFFSVLSVPFVASVNAHEDMLWIAIVGILEVILKLCIALLLPYLYGDKLIYYGGLVAFVGFISLVLYIIFCTRKYEECTFNLKKVWDSKLQKELASFAGWNLFGAACGVGRNQGISIIFNLFFGTMINAAYGIANQVASQMNFFSATMLRALNPQIMKSEGAGDRDRMLKFSMVGSKFGFFLLAIFAIPCMLEMTSILNVWLKDIPQYTPVFCQLILISILVNQMTIGLQSSLQAVGRIKVYQVAVGCLLLLNLPTAYIILRFGYPIYIVLVSYIVFELFACLVRILLVKWVTGLGAITYLKKVVLPILAATLPVLIIGFLIVKYVDFEFRFLFTCSLLISLYLLTIWFLGLNQEEKCYVKNLMNKIKMNYVLRKKNI